MPDAEYVNIWMRPERPAYGPKPAYSRAQITEAAVRIADAEGLEAATMRRIATEISAGAMSLYRYIPGRDDLIELMADHLMGEIDVEGMPSGDWRADLSRYANGLRGMWLRHPWIATVHRSLPSFGPNQMRLIERVMGVLDAHVPIDQTLRLMAMLNSHVEGTVREEISWAEEVRRSGLNESEWMARSSPRIHQLVSSGEYPIFTKIVMEARQPHLSRDDQFRNGLEHILDCISTALRTSRDETPVTTIGETPIRDETPVMATGGTLVCDETTDYLAPPHRCTVCGDPVPQAVTGRPRQYCSRACQQHAYRARRRPDTSE